MKDWGQRGALDSWLEGEPESSSTSYGWTGASPRVWRIAKGIHILRPQGRRKWEVRTLGTERLRQRFESWQQALSFALEMQRREGSDVIVHLESGGSRRIKILEAEPRPESTED